MIKMLNDMAATCGSCRQRSKIGDWRGCMTIGYRAKAAAASRREVTSILSIFATFLGTSCWLTCYAIRFGFELGMNTVAAVVRVANLEAFDGHRLLLLNGSTARRRDPARARGIVPFLR